MGHHGKNYRKAAEAVDRNATYSLLDAATKIKEIRYAKFNESIDLAVRLNVDPRHADQQIRGTVALPHGTGKDVRVLVFAKGEAAKEAEQAGADFVGDDELADKIQKEGWLEFDACVATPDMMRVVGRLGKVLGPRGLMPNPKTGTVTPNVAEAVQNLKSGQIQFRVERKGIVQCAIGKVEFTAEQIAENAKALIDELMRKRPSSVKGGYVKSIAISSTMGPGFRIAAE
ncbi:50S ribosomal protein L1 [Candidatus Sumerlaeota bacterium]|nr:50S ribosomal protein L1 [Candidatus Sumerlaeota bacterium]